MNGLVFDLSKNIYLYNKISCGIYNFDVKEHVLFIKCHSGLIRALPMDHIILH